MNENEMERVSEWNQPTTLGQMRESGGGTLSPRAGRMIAPPTTGSDRKRWDYRQAPDRVAPPVTFIR